MSLPLYASFIDGKTVDNAPSAFDLVKPHDGNVIGRIAESGPASIAFSKHRKQPAHVRIGWLKAAAKAPLEGHGNVCRCDLEGSSLRPRAELSRCDGFPRD